MIATVETVIALVAIFISGLLLVPALNIAWEWVRLSQVIHIFGSALLILFPILPFLHHHIKGTVFTRRKSSVSGILILLVFISIVASGLYLFFFGNPGGEISGYIAHTVHLYLSFVLIVLLFWHTSKIFRHKGVLVFAVSVVLTQPLYSMERLSNITLEKGVHRYHVQEWSNSTTCKECHSDIFKQWANSNHRHMADSNPYYMVMENLAEMDRGVEFRKWCMGCHNPSAVTMDQKRTTHFMDDNLMPDPLFVQDSKNLQESYEKHPYRLEQGLSCIGCHSITKATPKGNSSFSLGLKERKTYMFENSPSKTRRWIANRLIEADPKVHKASYMRPLYKKSRFCASCHDETLPHNGKHVVTTFRQWQNSPYNDPNNPQKHKECIDCHMKQLHNGSFTNRPGRSTRGGSIKKDIKVHYFAGGNYFLAGLKNDENRDQSIQLLKTSAKLDAAVQNNTLIVGVTNTGAGHKLPTGAADFRQLWLDITLKDAKGKTILSSGKLDKHGNIEKGSVIFNKVFGDKEGKPVGLMFWRYEKLLRDTRIDAGKRVQNSFPIPQNAKYPLQAIIKLNFRIYPQWVTDIVKAAYPALPDPPVITIASMEKSFE